MRVFEMSKAVNSHANGMSKYVYFDILSNRSIWYDHHEEPNGPIFKRMFYCDIGRLLNYYITKLIDGEITPKLAQTAGRLGQRESIVNQMYGMT